MKQIVMFLFVSLILGVGGWAFMSMQRETLKDKITEGIALVRMEGVTVYRFSGHKLQSKMYADQVTLYGNQVVLLEGNLEGQDLDRTESNRLRAQKGKLLLSEPPSFLGQKEVNVTRAELEDRVDLILDDHRLETESAVYQSQELTSSVPVKVQGPNRRMSARDGFRYQMETETLDLFGPVEGILDGLP